MTLYLERRPDWPARFRRAMSTLRRRPFDQQACNCALTAADVVEAITGTDPAEDFRALSARAQIVRLRREGGIEAYLTRLFPSRAGHDARARRGDVATVTDEHGQVAVAIVEPPHLWAQGPAGLTRLPLSSARRVFEIG